MDCCKDCVHTREPWKLENYALISRVLLGLVSLEARRLSMMGLEISIVCVHKPIRAG